MYASTAEMEPAVPGLAGLPPASRRNSRSATSSTLNKSFLAELTFSDKGGPR